MRNWDWRNSDEEETENDPPYLEKLNPEQRKAVLHTEGPVMIIAGAGSGKTRVLTFRIAHLVRKGTDPFAILALTFTNKAAREMRERIETLVGASARNLWMGTFHSIFARILRYEADRLGFPKSFTIYDTDDSKSLIKAIVKEMNLDDKVYKPSLILGRISMAKNNLIEIGDYQQNQELLLQDKNANRPKFVEIFATYTHRCFKAGAMDFDDILLFTYKLFRDHIDVCNKWQHKFKYIMVDEYQDTNHVQYLITKRLAAVHQNICVVGDDAQSIYAFRGANIQNILNYKSDYDDVAIFKLEQNYRSTKTIVGAAGEIIKNNKKQLEKSVWTQNDTGEKIKVVRSITEAEEARFVAQSIFEERNKHQLPNKAFAILYRTNSQSRAFEEGLRKLNIDYQIYGGISFYQRKEIKDVLSYLRLIANPNDEEALKRVINLPARGIGDTTINRLILEANTQGVGLWTVVSNPRSFQLLTATFAKVENFALMIQSFQSMIGTHNAYDLAMHVVKQTTLLKSLYDDKTVEGVSRYENVMELMNGIKEFVEDDESQTEKDLASFLQEVALYTDERKKDDPNRDTVSLMTIHASKGLEFPHVYLVGMEENLFPSQMALQSRAELEEERRLFYVALTRAEKKLSLCFATSRFKYGNLLPCEPSRFIAEIPAEFLDMSLNSLRQEGVHQYLGNLGQNNSEAKTKLSSLLKSNEAKSKTVSSHIIDPNFVPDNLDKLQAGMQVLHQRFGKGIVAEISTESGSKNAIIDFEESGRKMLMLKFAKMKILS